MDRVLVANRGEIAIRIVRAVHELGGLAIAVHPADDVDSAHVAAADDAIELPGVGAAAYLDIDAVVAAGVESGATSVHPGYGFLSENADFARRCAHAGLTFIGPRPELLELFGDKTAARAFAVEQQIPVLPGTASATTLAEIEAFAAEHGPVMIKAVAGGGGRGMRAVPDPRDIPEAFDRCSSEARQAFGNGDLYVERLVLSPQHIEVQIVGDRHGAIIDCGERDCTIQRRHQKLIEVTPSPWLTEQSRQALIDAALRLVQAANYESLGTVEFLVDGNDFYFIEANPRLQVEHTVTEEVTGVDLVRAQIRIASGARLKDLGLADAPIARGVALQARVNLETVDSQGQSQPSVGVIETFDPPSGPGIRVDTYGRAGYMVSPRYDSLIAKVVARAENFESAVARLTAALGDFHIGGVSSNLDQLGAMIATDEFTSTVWDTGFAARHVSVTPSAHPVSPVSVDALEVRAPLAGVVLSVETQPEDTVGRDGVLLVIEAMKMEHVVRAPASLRVIRILVGVGDVVQPGAQLLLAEAIDAADVGPDSDVTTEWSAEVDEIARRREHALSMGGPQKVQRQRDTGRLTARERITALSDIDSFAELGALTAVQGPNGLVPANFIAGTARIADRKVILGVDDFTVRGGSGDGAVHAKQVFLEEYAGEMQLPMIRLLDGASGGGSVKMIVDSGATYVPVNPGWDAVVSNLSVVPVVAAALGPTVGLGAARLVMSHFAVMVADIGQMFTAGPPVVRAATGEDLSKEQLGGADVHRDNGSIERVVANEQEAFDAVREFLSYLPSNVHSLPPVRSNTDPVDRRDETLLSAVPRNPRRPYVIEPILDAVFDVGSVFRYADYGDGTVTALARLDGFPVGVVTADPGAGVTMSVEGALAVTRLVDLCETFHLPLVSLTDQAGMTIGAAAERRATIRHGARALTAVYQTRVPQAELIMRRVYGVGGAGIVNRHRAVRSWAWPSGDWGSLPSQGGIEAAFRAQIDAADDPEAEKSRLGAQLAELTSVFRTAERFGVQDIIDPRESRALLCDWVRDAYQVLPSLLGKPSFGTRP